ncbi:MAG: DUF975 family protein [Provencibacterium sp.]|jgi:uncharacterized membrane protein|nr:DUF975 family protein [Provencibacterium sp.]
MSIRSKVKSNARRVLGQHYIKALIIVLILICVVFLFSLLMMVANVSASAFGYLKIMGDWNYLLSPAIVLVTLLLQLVLFSPLLIGASRWFYRLVGNEPGDIVDLFDYFAGAKNYFGSVWLEINLFVRRLFYTFLFTIIPIALTSAGLELFNGFWSPEPVPAAVASVVGGMLTLAGSILLALTGIFSWIFCKRYLPARYIYAEGGCSVRRAIKQSVYCMKGRKAELFLFDLSYLGWFLSCILVIPILFVAPYYLSAQALYVRVIMEYGQRTDTKDVPEQEPTREFTAEPPVSEPDSSWKEPEELSFDREGPQQSYSEPPAPDEPQEP